VTSRYDEIQGELARILGLIVHTRHLSKVVPISGFVEDNMINKSSNVNWDSGGAIFETLNLLVSPKRRFRWPLCLPIQDVYKIDGIERGRVSCVESGIMKSHQSILFAPAGVMPDVKSIEIHHEE
jgi:elongation factor 1-alpha